MRGARYVCLIPWTLHSGSEQLWLQLLSDDCYDFDDYGARYDCDGCDGCYSCDLRVMVATAVLVVIVASAVIVA